MADSTPRTIWLAAKTPVTMLLLVLLVVFAGTWGIKAATSKIVARPSAPCVTQTLGPELTPAHTTVQIYNGTNTNGLAKRVRLLLNAEGFRVIKSVNSDEPYAKTTIVGFSAESPEVALVKSYFDPVVVVADATRIDHHVDVMVGSDFKNLAAGLKSVPLANGTACLPTSTASTNTGG